MNYLTQTAKGTLDKSDEWKGEHALIKESLVDELCGLFRNGESRKGFAFAFVNDAGLNSLGLALGKSKSEAYALVDHLPMFVEPNQVDHTIFNHPLTIAQTREQMFYTLSDVARPLPVVNPSLMMPGV